MRADARFADPEDAQVIITLHGSLKEFEALSKALWAKEQVPYWQSQALLEAIRDAASKLRNRVSVQAVEGPVA